MYVATYIYMANCSQLDVQQHVDRGSMQMVLTPYDLFFWNKHNIKVNSITHIIYINYMVIVSGKIAHSVHADPSSSCPTGPFLLVLAHIVPALIEHWLLISLTSVGASLTHLPQADPISLRTQAMPCFHVRHTNNVIFLISPSFSKGIYLRDVPSAVST